MRVLIPDDSNDFVVTWGSWMNLRSDPLVVIYDRSGRLLHQLKLNDLLTRTDINQMGISTSVSEWANDAEFNFAIPETSTVTPQATGTITHIKSHPEKTRLNITFKWGKKISIELATGKVENAAWKTQAPFSFVYTATFAKTAATVLCFAGAKNHRSLLWRLIYATLSIPAVAP
ncbi:hypothetical protein B1R32_10232 [Abditibacterium utsteinense]|uniref:Uncharacterized protein n=1 Tax=Abditibacterium utsteinense TaxID=1960156 RepID=A0A2S8SW51_9BACT|nr:hypothetical protein [Abditibacterium utsteinense]PQV65025.1 hypothetical protein B1R32_10232 [Abditibacterium utsteinense]